MSSAPTGRRATAIGAVALFVVFTVVVRVQPGGVFVTRAVDDLGEAVVALLSGGTCLWRARRSAGRMRASWALLGAAAVAWGLGQSVWTWYELVSDVESPFPSLADLGYLLFPVLALPGLLVRSSTALTGSGRVRLLLDGVMVACSLLVISWLTSLGAVFDGAGGSSFALLVSLAYPVSDIVLITIAVLIGIHSRARAGLVLLMVGLGSMSVADSWFVYMTAVGDTPPGSLSDIGWMAAFLAIGVSATYTPADEADGVATVESPLSLALPYALVLVSVSVEVVGALRSGRTSAILAVAAAAMLALIVRQFLTLLDNRRLTRDVLAQQAELQFRAFHDGLTGLANRATFYDRLSHALALRDRDARPVSVLFCDLDDFKSVNDTLGHDAGDAVLTAVGQRLDAVARAGDTVARLGGDEFAMIIEYECDLDALARRLLDVLAAPVALAEREIQVRASVGTATVAAGEGAVTSHELLKRADDAMYVAKHEGKGRAVSFAADLGGRKVSDMDERIALREDIRTARVQTAFQPIVDRSGASIAYEALARWQYGGVAVPPSRFVPMADRGGLLADLDMLIVHAAVRRLAEIQDVDVKIAINLGLSSLLDAGLPQRLTDLLAAARISPDRLVVELPETQVGVDAGAAGALAGLKERGFGIAIDDFGVGYSNLARLAALEPDVVKLDRSLVAPLPESATALRIVDAAIGLAHDLGATVTAEGVETREQADALCELGCDAMQGHFFGRPVLLDRCESVDFAA